MAGFDTLLGTRRGPPVAAPTRTRRRRRLTSAQPSADVLETFAADIFAVSNSRTAVTELTAAYRAGVRADRAEVVQFLCNAARNLRDTRELVAIAAYGDPEGYPGFTNPAVLALAQYFADPPEPKSHRLDVTWRQHALEACFRSHLLGSPPAEHYRRLRPLCKEFGRYIAHRPSLQAEVDLSVCAIGVLGAAPTAVLSGPGPLRSWVTAYAQLLDDARPLEVERKALEVIVSAAAADPKRAAALAPIAERLAAQP